MEKHWTAYLDEGRRIFRDEVEHLTNLNERLEKAKSLVSSIENEIQELEESIIKTAFVKEYNLHEIKLAKQTFELATLEEHGI